MTRVRSDIVIVFVLLLCAVKFTWDIPQQMVIAGYDETVFLTRGVDLLETGVPHQDFSPLYSLWYFLLSLVVSDPLELYYLNIRVLTILTVVLSFIAARMLGAGQFASGFIAVFLLLSNGNVPLMPRIGQFTALGILVVLAIILGVPKRWKAPLAVMGLALLSFARPEFIFASIILGTLIAAYFFVRRDWRMMARVLLPLGVFVAVLGGIQRIPSISDNSRSIWAFGQHYAGYTSAAEGSSEERWMHWEDVVRRDFDGARTIPEAAVANPDAFFGHILRNASAIPPRVFEGVFRHSNLFLSASQPGMVHVEAVIFLIAVLAVITWIVLFHRKRLKEVLTKHAVPYGMIAVVLFIVLLDCLVVNPRFHYIWVAVPVSFVGLAALIPSLPIDGRIGRTLLLTLPLLIPVYRNQDYDAGSDQLKALIGFSREQETIRGVILGDPSWIEIYFRGTGVRYSGVWNWEEFEGSVRKDEPILIWSNTTLKALLKTTEIDVAGYVSLPRSELLVREDLAAMQGVMMLEICPSPCVPVRR